MCRTLVAKVRGKLAEEGLDRYFFGLNAEMEAIPEFSKTATLPSTDLSPFATFISRSRVTN